MSANNPKYILIHCTDYSYRLLPDQRKACEGWHKDRDFPVSSLGSQVGYHRLVTGGTNYQCRLDTDEGAHCNQLENGLSMNFQSLGICIGFDGDIEMPPSDDYFMLQQQVWDWQDKYNIPASKVRFHRYYAKDKTCPGTLITDQWLQDLLTRPKPVPVIPKLDTCIAEKAEIAILTKKVSWYTSIVDKIKLFLNSI